MNKHHDLELIVIINKVFGACIYDVPGAGLTVTSGQGRHSRCPQGAFTLVSSVLIWYKFSHTWSLIMEPKMEALSLTMMSQQFRKKKKNFSVHHFYASHTFQ